MAVEFVRNPKNPGLNQTTEPDGTIFQSVLALIGFECYLTVDIFNNMDVVNGYYTRKQSEGDGEEIEWFTIEEDDVNGKKKISLL